MTDRYDDQNIFARILRGEIPNKTVHEDDWALAFEDVAPKATVHILVIPKGPYVDYGHFAREASDDEILGFTRALGQVCEQAGLEGGYRVVANTGADGGQEVPHFHLHILGGEAIGPIRA
ncbi:HIT domain-containing protein [Pseudoroseicyclus aestuarii]|uniref:Diadenosine tetraphosphate (Ap4A) HIT family hydrolase n=1 Tax=Pseudoroseicyclus aestuarii TaxID=1795041 RepID=A0A318SVD1_9RHOB|nr:HIT domain-containing protein [Pseudoroseicyclus aestuarii]PYE83817.1 diadenosine tetraphosphate (Ap4A) HIT family hydrolase [Pseudoroseicyclus aestuarii]